MSLYLEEGFRKKMSKDLRVKKRESDPESFRGKGSAAPQEFLQAVPGGQLIFIMKALSHRKSLIIAHSVKAAKLSCSLGKVSSKSVKSRN